MFTEKIARLLNRFAEAVFDPVSLTTQWGFNGVIVLAFGCCIAAIVRKGLPSGALSFTIAVSFIVLLWGTNRQFIKKRALIKQAKDLRHPSR